ncbi:MAG: TOBE domain-containing protein [Sulfuricurvum sp.]
MKTTARNELSGIVVDIKSGGVMSEVLIEVGENITVCATITNDSLASLGIARRSAVSALIKASHIVLSKQKLNASARNNIEASISGITKGAVNSEVRLQVGGKKLFAVVTNDAIADLGLEPKQSVWAIFKASSVIVVA